MLALGLVLMQKGTYLTGKSVGCLPAVSFEFLRVREVRFPVLEFLDPCVHPASMGSRLVKTANMTHA